MLINTIMCNDIKLMIFFLSKPKIVGHAIVIVFSYLKINY